MSTEEVLEVAGKKFPLKIYIERRNNYSAALRKSGVVIRLPRALPLGERIEVTQKLKEWAIKKLAEKPHRFNDEPRIQYQDGNILKIREEDFLIRFHMQDHKGSKARLVGNEIHILLAQHLSPELQQQASIQLISKCLSQKFYGWIKEKIQSINQLHFRQPIESIHFKHVTSKWGSCSSTGKITLSTRLLFAPEKVVEYVCVHELAHLLEHNHSERFWVNVERAMPDYKECRTWLKIHGDQCKF